MSPLTHDLVALFTLLLQAEGGMAAHRDLARDTDFAVQFLREADTEPQSWICRTEMNVPRRWWSKSSESYKPGRDPRKWAPPQACCAGRSAVITIANLHPPERL